MVTAEQQTGTSRQPPVGIDLGTTISVVAYVDASGRPITIPNSRGDILTPSAVAFEEQTIIVGREAIKLAPLAPNCVADCFKRDMGRSHFRRRVVEKEVPPEVLSAFLLDRLKTEAERCIGPIHQVVITVPAFFDETRRRATQEAGRLAGLNVLDIINEPTAAAIAYGHGRSIARTGQPATSERVLIFDLGGGTFDVTVLQIDGTALRTLATDGDVELGGRDFDERLVNHVAERFLAMHGADPRSDPSDAAQLWAEVQDAKHTLSERERTTIVCSHAGVRMRLEVTRSEFEDLIRDLIDRIRSTTSLVVREAGQEWNQIDRVLLVGGSTRIPMVFEMLRELTGKDPDRSLSADEVVAHGAALYAQMLTERKDAGSTSATDLINVNSHSLGVIGLDPATGRKVNVILIPRNTPLPSRAVRKFRTARKSQSSVKVSVVEGESQHPDFCISLGECVIRDLPPNLPERSEIEVEYQYAANGRLSVCARVPSIRESARVEIDRNDNRQLDDLATWGARLCGIQTASDRSVAPSRATTIDDPMRPTDRAGMIKQLDELYIELGKKAAALEVPAPVQRSKESANVAATELRRAEATLQEREKHNPSRLGSLAAPLAQARQVAQQTKSKADFAYLVLGRECANADYCPLGFAREWGVIQALRKRLT